VFWPVIIGELGFIIGYVLVTPAGCATTATTAREVGHTTCENVIGLDYSGTGTDNPSLLPALLAAMATSVAAAAAAWIWLHRRSVKRRA
jgi:hypothetical protein